MKVFNLFLIFLLVSCSTTEKYDEKLNQLIGKKKSVLLAEWGAPDSESKDEHGDQYLTYKYHRGSKGIIDQEGGYISTKEKYCKTTFVIKNETISDWNHEGNACKSK
jgi:hypothetical protein